MKRDYHIVDLLADRPVYRHDCPACQWLGTIGFDAPLSDGSSIRKQADLYVCQQETPANSTLLARFSDTDSDYSSTLTALVTRDYQGMQERPATNTPAILEAYRRVKEKP